MQADNILTARSELVHRERSIPGFELLLDPERLLTHMRGQLDIRQVETIRLNYLRYKPGMNCLARYELRVAGQTVSAYAKAHGKDALYKMSKSLERPVSDTTLGPGRVIMEDQQIIFSIFPNDSKLVSLQCLNDMSYRERLLGRVFGQDSQWQGSEFRQALNYKPERRYVVRLMREDGKSSLLKLYSRGGYERARVISRKLTSNRHDFYPETIGRSKKHHVVAYRWRPGTTLRQLTIDGRLSSSELVAAAESLVEFHGSGRAGLSPVLLEDQVKRLNALAEQLAILLPHLKQRAKRVTHKLAEWLAAQEPVLQPVHGDFYDKQAVIKNGKASLIDLDAACLGHPCLDLGSYVAHLERLAGNGGISAAEGGFQKDSLIGAYENLTDSICPVQLDKYTALALFGLIHHPFRDWTGNWPAQTRLLLERVESLCAA